jgi:hypothetical protein
MTCRDSIRTTCQSPVITIEITETKIEVRVHRVQYAHNLPHILVLNMAKLYGSMSMPTNVGTKVSHS